jgi:TrpR-related protein YerC/YecD
MSQGWKNKKSKKMYNAFLQSESADEVAAICMDLMTENEMNEFAGRFAVVKELYSGKSQRQLSSERRVSIATITRVNQWLKRGMNGYKTILSRLNHHHPQ